MAQSRRDFYPTVLALFFLCVCGVSFAATAPAILETDHLRLIVTTETGVYQVLDKQSQVTWNSNPFTQRMGTVVFKIDGADREFSLSRCEVAPASGNKHSLRLTFHPIDVQPAATVTVTVEALSDRRTLEFRCETANAPDLVRVSLLENGFYVTDADQGYVVVPVREGLMIPANSGKAFTHSFDTYAYEGCHMTMIGLVKGGSAAMVTWSDVYGRVDIHSAMTPVAAPAVQVVSPTLTLHSKNPSFKIQFCGRGDYVTLAKAYREEARKSGWLVTWDEKLKKHPADAKLFGAANFKLWSALTREMNSESTQEKSLSVSWTFDEAAQVAEHIHNDLGLTNVLFTIGGWIHRGYDNQHPDILPAAPELGGNDALADCSRRILKLGYLFSLHDNYQDIYKDSPSWNEKYITKNRDGSLSAGGSWAGGRAYLTCSKMALELARRPQNLTAVKQLTGANSYFIDTTYAAGLQECFDPAHPLTRADDMHWKQALSDYARDVFGQFGSECGREWAIPHADFFEGLTGVSGTYYHNAGLPESLGASVIPFFELVYRDTIAAYGKYGYDMNQAAEYVLQHILIGRPLNYHEVPAHLYWKNYTSKADARLAPPTPNVEITGPREFRVTYHWVVREPLAQDYRAFNHFTDADGKIQFQNDYTPAPATSKWAPGTLDQGPFTVHVPEGLTGTFTMGTGLFDPSTDTRLALAGTDGGGLRYSLGSIKVTATGIEFIPVGNKVAEPMVDPGLFVRGDQGWTQGLHPQDRFLKNTYEVLSPLNELTARMQMTSHVFVTPDRKVQKAVYGKGRSAVEVVVNMGREPYALQTRRHGLVQLLPFGFAVESATFAAFHALSWNGMDYARPVMFSIRSADGKSLESSRKIRVFHAFGDPRIKLAGAVHTVEREQFVPR